MYAVEPDEVRRNARRLTTEQILTELDELHGASLVVLSGGNPALHELGELVNKGHERGYTFSVETQGSVWRDWLNEVDTLVVSPKPPSAAPPQGKRHDAKRRIFCEQANVTAVKIVVGNVADYEWALGEFERWPNAGKYLSALTDQDPPATLQQVADRYRWLCERAAADPRTRRFAVKVLPQLHVVAWGHSRGV